LITSWNYKFF